MKESPKKEIVQENIQNITDHYKNEESKQAIVDNGELES